MFRLGSPAHILLLAIGAGALLGGCATRSFVRPKLAFESLNADREGPQAAGSTIRWNVVVTGGVGDLTHEFRLRTDGRETVTQTGTSATWAWSPAEAGSYAVRVTSRDGLGYTVRSEWSPEYEITPALVLNALTSGIEPPQRAKSTDVLWKVDAAGGVGQRVYEFRLDDGEIEARAQDGPSAVWIWSPRDPGRYRVKAIVRDERGNVADSGWSAPYVISPAVSRKTPIAVLPFENLSGRSVPLDALRAGMVDAMRSNGLEVLGNDTLQGFMARHRMRYVGGLSRDLGRAFEEEAGVAAVLVGSVEQYLDADPPKLAVHARLVGTGEKAPILWIGGVARAGHESPGFLDLRRVQDIEALSERAVARIAETLAARVSAEERPAAGTGRKHAPKRRRRFAPEGLFRSPDSLIDGRAERPRVAVLPFDNDSTRPEAGRIMALHFVRQMTGRPDVEVVEPGHVRQALLESRLILREGPSLSEAELLRKQLNVDLVITGTVTDYEDPAGESAVPVVGFFAQAIEVARRSVGWTTTSHARGTDRVFFFDRGRVYTAYELAARMVSEVTARTMERKDDS